MKRAGGSLALQKDVDHIIVHPWTEQMLGATHRDPWVQCTEDYERAPGHGLPELAYICRVLGKTPVRTAADRVMARLGAALLVRHASPGALIDIGPPLVA
eukprot:SAG11_NODE_5374_length_1580_cov_0.997974_3_plen_100_part_00